MFKPEINPVDLSPSVSTTPQQQKLILPELLQPPSLQVTLSFYSCIHQPILHRAARGWLTITLRMKAPYLLCLKATLQDLALPISPTLSGVSLPSSSTSPPFYFTAGSLWFLRDMRSFFPQELPSHILYYLNFPLVCKVHQGPSGKRTAFIQQYVPDT